MHAFQVHVQWLLSLHPVTLQCKSLQLQASRVTIATGNSAARDLFVYTTRAKQAMKTQHLCINCNQGGYRVRVPSLATFNCMHAVQNPLSLLVHVQATTS